ncbi:hypothetical protein JOB18_009181 [Solea senegalensis]|uniref:Secreted protein n=1 Tax=Solea senegalensis TaxID=28829 RepID=A0AAV6QK40_SOLSE|nr:hypothetical protein JOB18_009181 [Solea senegalensis]
MCRSLLKRSVFPGVLGHGEWHVAALPALSAASASLLWDLRMCRMLGALSDKTLSNVNTVRANPSESSVQRRRPTALRPLQHNDPYAKKRGTGRHFPSQVHAKCDRHPGFSFRSYLTIVSFKGFLKRMHSGLLVCFSAHVLHITEDEPFACL